MDVSVAAEVHGLPISQSSALRLDGRERGVARFLCRSVLEVVRLKASYTPIPTVTILHSIRLEEFSFAHGRILIDSRGAIQSPEESTEVRASARSWRHRILLAARKRLRQLWPLLRLFPMRASLCLQLLRSAYLGIFVLQYMFLLVHEPCCKGGLPGTTFAYRPRRPRPSSLLLPQHHQRRAYPQSGWRVQWPTFSRSANRRQLKVPLPLHLFFDLSHNFHLQRRLHPLVDHGLNLLHHHVRDLLEARQYLLVYVLIVEPEGLLLRPLATEDSEQFGVVSRASSWFGLLIFRHVFAHLK